LGERLQVQLPEGNSLISDAEIIVRPEDFVFVREESNPLHENTIEAQVAELIFEGSTYTIRLRCKSGREIFLEKRTAHWVENTLKVDQNVVISIPSDRFRIVSQQPTGSEAS
jgi:ABC-type Fe3+/spermidine/putrescine transport system ATPase subunit